MKKTIQTIKAITLSIVGVFAVLMIEPVRFFAGMAAAVVFGMLVVDTIKEYRKTQKEKVRVKRK